MLTTHQYLSLRERLSQGYLNKYTIVFMLLSLKVFLFKRSLMSSISSVSGYLVCSEALQEFPEALSNLVSNLIESNLANLQYNYLVLIKLTISIIKNLLIFYVDIFLGTCVCLLDAAISATADFALETTESLITTVNATVVAISEDISDGLDGLTYFLNKIISTANTILDFFSGTTSSSGGTAYINQINLSISALQNLSIPSSVLTSIENFRQNDLLDFDDLNNATSELISYPFNLASSELSESIFNSSMARNTSILNTTVAFPIMTSFNPLCDTSQELEDAYKSLSRMVENVSKCILIALIVAAFLSILPLAFQVYSKWRREINLVDRLNEIAPCSPVGTRNIINRFDNSLIYYLHKFNITRNSHAYWLTSYVTSPFAVTVLFIGVSGLLAALLQYVILRVVKREVKSMVSFASSGSSTTSAISKSTELYLNRTDEYLIIQEAALNAELFGHIKSMSSSLNETLDTFMTGVNKTINTFFGDTPFAGPINTIVYCTLGRKVKSLETGITWINNNLKISIPSLEGTFRKDILSLANSQSNSDVGVAISSGLQDVLDAYSASIWLEFEISMSLFALWLLQLVIGALILLFRAYLHRPRISKPSSIPCPSGFTVAKKYINTSSISGPRPLTTEQRLNYGYPFMNPYENHPKYDLTSMDHPSHSDNTRIGSDSEIKQIRSSSSYYTSTTEEFSVRPSSKN